MNQQPQILLIHNRFHFRQPITWLSYLIRVFTCSKWNHLAIKVGDKVVESIGRGVIETPWEQWKSHANRIVLPLTPVHPVDPREIMALRGMPYGKLDLVQIARKIKTERWDGGKWQGRNFEGFICSELGLVLLGKKGLLSPADFEYMPGLVRGEEYETKKK